MGESKRNTQGGGGIVVAGVCDVFSEGEGGGIVGVVRVSARIRASGPCLACATPKQGARVCSKGGGGPWGGNLWSLSLSLSLSLSPVLSLSLSYPYPYPGQNLPCGAFHTDFRDFTN
jgi:hypothetical protein